MPIPQSTHPWLPAYCDPRSFLPSVQEAVVLFSRPPYLFQDFVGKALAFLRGEMARKMGFVYEPATALPCKWKCSDESLFGVDLCLYAYTGKYPFDKGLIGGRFNESSVAAAVHHSPINVDFGGAHVGYVPGPNGGVFGKIARPLREGEVTTDCGYLMALLAPFKEVYDDACRNIFLSAPTGGEVLASIPNEYLQPSWSSHRIKLIVDIERFAAGVVPYDVAKPHTHKLAGRSLLVVSEAFLSGLGPERLAAFKGREATSIGSELTADYFNIFDSRAELVSGVPVEGILPYVKYILSSRVAPFPLKAAVTSSNIEYNRLTDTVRTDAQSASAFASFTGVFIDIFDEMSGAYVNLFQPIGIAIKVAGRRREIEISPAEVHAILDPLEPVAPVLPLAGVLGYPRPTHVLDAFTFTAGSFRP
jgi:hypothetical protein